jgi:hypothetical protein
LVLGKLKQEIFVNQIKYLVDAINTLNDKEASSTLKDFQEEIEALNVPEMRAMEAKGLELGSGLEDGAISGSLVGLAAYGAVGELASASTGTAIASLSGVAAKNATLAWLGGGPLAVGGLGMAGGTVVLGGVVVGPALAVAGWRMASGAEKALTEARKYANEADIAIAEIDKIKVVLAGLRANVSEKQTVLLKLVDVFDSCKVPDATDVRAFDNMLKVGKSLKDVLATGVMEDDGNAVVGFGGVLKRKVSGVLKY